MYYYLVYYFYWSRYRIAGALMLSGDEDVNDWDARKYPRCKPYYGKKGMQWNNFVRDFSISLLDETDADASLKETMLGTDPGGDVYLAGGGAPLGAAAASRRNRRLTRLYAALYRHVADLRLREMMDTDTPDGGRAAYLLLDRHCRRDVTDLEMFDLDKQVGRLFDHGLCWCQPRLYYHVLSLPLWSQRGSTGWSTQGC